MANFSTSPLAIDEYARFMVDVFDERQIIGVSTVFQAFFGRPETGARTLFSPDAAVVDIDIVRGNDRPAALITRGANARDLGTGQANTIQQQFSHISRIYPLIEEMGDIDSNQLLFRRPGESPMSTATRLDRMRSHASEHHQEHVRRIVRLFEYMASQSILNGQMPSILGTSDPNLLYDFLRNATHNFNPPLVWTNASSKPIDDLEDAAALIRQDGHAKADVVLMGADAIDAFVRHSTVQALADNRRFELIQVGQNPVPPNLQRFVDAGAIPRGRLRTPKGYEMWLFVYIDGYTNSGGTFTPYMPVDDVIVAASSARCDRYFGPGEKLPDIPMRDQLYQQLFGIAPGLEPMPPMVRDVNRAISPAMFSFDAYVSENWKRVSIRTQSAPIFATTQTDAFATIETVV
jgi:hypothetical protein